MSNPAPSAPPPDGSVTYNYVNDDFESELECPICMKPFLDPVSLPCDHVACESCMRRCFITTKSCPCCRQKYKESDIKPASRIIRNLVDKLMVRCNNEQCSWTGPRSLLVNHMDNCEKSVIVCPNSGCNARILRRDYASHIQSCTRCSCKYTSDGCQWTGTREQMILHAGKCVYGVVSALRVRVAELESELAERDRVIKKLRETPHTEVQKIPKIEPKVVSIPSSSYSYTRSGDEYPNVPSGYEELYGECYYKSGWVEIDWPGGLLAFGTVKGPKYCWLQWTGWSLYLYTKAQWWYNWKRSGNPEEDAAFLMKMANALPDFMLPSLPGLPNLKMPSLSMPSIVLPSIDMPVLKMPSLSSTPKRKVFRESYYIVYAYCNDNGTFKRTGKTVTLTFENATLYYEGGDNEEKKNYKLTFKAPNDDQGESWYLSIRGNNNGMIEL